MVSVRDVPESWPVEASTDLHRDAWVLALRSDRVRRPGDHDEEAFRRLVVEHPGAAVVLAIDEQDRVLCIRQYRHAAQARLLELPAGVIDHPGEDPEQVARRELREEAAFRAERWTHLLSTYSSPGYSAEKIHYYLAEGLAPTDRGDFVLEHEEADLEQLWVPFDELVDAVLSGAVADGPVVQVVLALQVRRERERTQGR
ncbi:NUDIX hydrolase [Nocardioides sp. Root79]|nr:NUDIX hydrolase [Nocardioides sp. Root79]KRC75800.1 NUDIX hydrolase [Nocardioides sp. Root240]